MNSRRAIRYHAKTAVFAAAMLTTEFSLRADPIFPATNPACAAFSGVCSGGGGGAVGQASGSASADFFFNSSGVLSGSDIPAGASIPYSFSFSADAINSAGTNITNAVFLPLFSDNFPPPPPPVIGSAGFGFSFVAKNYQQISTIDFLGNCAPLPPSPTNTHWCVTEHGSGTLNFPQGLPVGTPVLFGGVVEIDTTNISLTPRIDLFSATVNFNPVPEPRYPALGLLVVGSFMGVWRATRKRQS